ncbi:MAG: hypothetical protein HOQ09_13665 [Gemmatimonadaceae bacterium]|nr:hypothetical protein [Gemmatimonadaceae bacterium]
MRRSMVAHAALALVLAATGCVSAGASRAAKRDRYLITSDEIVRSNASNAMEAVERLRPAFLTTRGPTSIQDPSPPTPIIYLDGIRYGSTRSLATIPALGIATIQYLPPIEAGMRYGLGHEGGAILVVTKH